MNQHPILSNYNADCSFYYPKPKVEKKILLNIFLKKSNQIEVCKNCFRVKCFKRSDYMGIFWSVYY